MGVSKNRGKTPKMDGLQWKTLLKWMIWGYPYFRKHPYTIQTIHYTPCFKLASGWVRRGFFIQTQSQSINQMRDRSGPLMKICRMMSFLSKITKALILNFKKKCV